GSLTADSEDAAAELSNNLVFSSGTVIRIISIGILPAIFEELLFRKFLIDRTIRHGEFISCAMSGIMFGLWHGNFQQFFFAFFIGVLFAFVYIRTGNIIYTMIMHASVNLVTSTVTVELFNALMKSMGIDMATGNINTNIDDSVIIKSVLPMLLLLLLWMGLLVSFQIVGFIMLIVKRKKFKLAVMPGEPARKAILHSMTHSVEMWIFFSFALLLFVYQYIPDIIATIIELNGKK
ncbi:MAG: CPBP family intramembrane metalloprotease, partial [Clostridiales bacterium]|nr:CPBP family intramembrane metalloprotease [Clostridiales bacterium]